MAECLYRMATEMYRKLVQLSLTSIIGMSIWCVMESPGAAGKYNPTRSIGDTAPQWNSLPGTDGKQHSSKDLDDRDVVVVVFTCNSCPYAVDYEVRLNELAKKYSAADSRVGVVAINVNKIEADLLPAMQQRAKEREFVFPYLFDETQQVAKQFGALRTPECFVLNRARKIVYMGAMDDNTDPQAVKTRYVEEAIAGALQGKQVELAETPPVGCLIRFARERRKSN